MLHRLETLYDAGQVKRLHTVPTVRNTSIAEHAYGSILIATELMRLNRVLSAEYVLSINYERVVGALMVHDAPELSTGDCPSPVKSTYDLRTIYDQMETDFYREQNIVLPTLNPLEADIVLASDCLDLGYCCVKEKQMGNRHPRIAAVFQNVIVYTLPLAHLAGVTDIRQRLAAYWKSA